MRREPLISVIVPVYGAERYLAQCVDSILGQTYRNLEAVLVDDGALDQSPAICDSYGKKDARVRVIHKENGGLISAWTRGVEESRGEYLCFVDSDDWIEAEMLEEMADHLTGSQAEIICGNFVIDRPGGSSAHYHRLAAGVYEKEALAQVQNRLLGNEERTICLSRCMKLFSRALIERNLSCCNPRIRMGEDVNIVLPAVLDAERVVILPHALHYHYRYHEASMVHRYDAGLYDNLRLLDRTVREIFSAKGVGNGAEQAQKEYLYLLLLAVKNELRGGRKGYAARIRQICRENHVKEEMKKYQISMEAKANRLLAVLMRHPSRPVLLGGKLAVDLFDRLQRREETKA